MWTYHNQKMKQLKQIYQRTNLQTQNKIQEIFDSYKIDFNQLFSIADAKIKRRINIYIEELKDKKLLKGTFGNLASKIYNRTKVKNSYILEFLIYSAYVEEQFKLEDEEMQIFKEDANYYYQAGQKEVNKTLENKKIVSIIPDAIFLSLLTIPNAKGYVYDDYKEAILKYNADQIYRQVIIDIQQQKPLEIESDLYQSIIKRQQNQKLNINGDKISGDIDLTLIGINNKAKSEGIYSFDKEAKVRFIAVEDEVTTKMCNSLNNRIFNVHDYNEFERYSESNGKNTKCKCYGLVIGLNMPPINDHFHWCRSTLVYNVNLDNYELIAAYNDIKLKELMTEIPDNIDDFAELWYNKSGYSKEITIKRKIYNDYQKQVELSKEGNKATFDKYYNNYIEAKKIGNIITNDNIEIGKIQPHTIYRLSCRNLTVNELVNILKKSKGELDQKHDSLLYTIDNKIIVSIANDENHNIKTIMKRRD